MIEGITVLNKTMIMGMPEFANELIVLLFIIFIVSVICSFASIIGYWDTMLTVSGVFLIGSAIVLLGLCFMAPVIEIPTDRYKYEVIIDESVQFTDIYEKYEVVEQRGEIWVLEDKSEQ